MARAIEQIERDIVILEETTSALAEELKKIYERYLIALGQATRQQLIVASYYLCTQGYPEAFLSLSFSQRQKLQQDIQKLARDAKQELLAQLDSPTSADIPTSADVIFVNQDTGSLELTEEYLEDLVEKALKAENQPQETPKEESFEAEENQQVEEKALTENSSLSSPIILNKPEQLTLWQEKLEKAIVKRLQKLSRDSNRLLHQAGILSKKLPEPLLEAAAKVEAAGESMPGPPNLLNLVIETESDPDSQTSTVTHLVAIHLRLSEIEFAEPTVATGRQQIRSLSAKLSNLRRDYQKKQREKAVAEAEAAWRSSWYEK
ncbi:MAG TPA: hypothetical protein V6D28_14135 [Leptolyngbyaceae cyanobacterium]